MSNVASKKKILGKTTETASHSRSRFIATVLPDDTLNPSADENCISNQGDRGRGVLMLPTAMLILPAVNKLFKSLKIVPISHRWFFKVESTVMPVPHL